MHLQYVCKLTCCNALTALIWGSAHEKYFKISVTCGYKTVSQLTEKGQSKNTISVKEIGIFTHTLLMHY